MTHLPDEGAEISSAGSLPPSPDTATPPDSSLSPVSASFRLLSWRAGVVLVGLLAYSLLSSLLRSPTSAYLVRGQRIEAFQDALRATKLAYGQRQIQSSKTGNNQALLREREDDALRQWTKLTQKKTSRPAEWRRLGITLFAFGRPGGLEALRHIATLPLSPTGATSNTADAPPSQEKKETVLIPRAQEAALWEAIYGPQPIAPSQVPELRVTLARLELDWFESLATAALYDKAKMPPEAARARARAENATLPLFNLLALQGNIFLVGLIALAGLLIKGCRVSGVGCRVLGVGEQAIEGERIGKRRKEKGESPITQLPNYPTTQFPDTQHPTPNTPLPGAALLITFALYLGVTMLIGLPFLLARPLILRLPDITAFRLNSILTITVQILVATIALKTLRRLASVASFPETPVSLRELLFRLGFRARSLSACVWAGLLGFAVSRPLIVIASLVSDRLFHNFPTPPHPLTLSVAVMRSPMDIFLLVLSSSILAPIVEEMMFRGMLYPALRARWGVVKGTALSAAVFSLVHPTMPGQFLPLWALGLVFTLTYEWRGSLLPGILIHALNNGLVLLTYFAILAQ